MITILLVAFVIDGRVAHSQISKINTSVKCYSITMEYMKENYQRSSEEECVTGNDHPVSEFD